MIIGMKKVTVLSAASRINEAVTKLKELGVLHVSHIRKPVSGDIDSANEKHAVLTRASGILADRDDVQNEKEQYVNYYQKAAEVLRLYEEQKEADRLMNEIRDSINTQKEWGDFDPADIRELHNENIFIKLYTATKKEARELPRDKNIRIISESGGMARLVFITRVQDEELDLRPVRLPVKSLSALQAECSSLEKKIKEIEEELSSYAADKNNIRNAEQEMSKVVEFQNVLHGMGKEEGFSYMQGFCPVTKLEELKRTADSLNWGLLTEEPDAPDETPTLIENPSVFKLIKPVFDFMNLVPGYKEYDISGVFLLFFSIFFAMLIGDAGYGIVFLLLTVFMSRKFKKAPREPFRLLYVLSVATIAWGAVTGTWFGFEELARSTFLGKLVVGKLDSFVQVNQFFIMHICFTIGVIHLTIANGLVILRIINSLMALARLGWILVLWALYFLAESLILTKAMPAATMPLLAAGCVLIAVFSEFDRKHIIRGTIVGVLNLPLKLISSFADIVSYLRLFAVGIASVSVAASFNQIAVQQIGFNNIIAGFFAALILFIGHSFNIVLGCMAILVHAVRLNVLEFSGQMGIQWSGLKYNPFKE